MRTLWIGDSHLVGMASRVRELAGARGWSGIVSAHVGWSTGRWASSGELPPLVARAMPEVLVVVLGTNDEPPNADDVRALLAQAPGVRAIWIGPFWTTKFDGVYAAASPEFTSGSSLAQGLPFPTSGSHLTHAQYGILAERLVAEVAAMTRGPMGPLLLGLGTAAAIIVALAVSFDKGRKTVWERKWKAGEARHPMFGGAR
jgi:lysophospholipase L1-like esterase